MFGELHEPHGPNSPSTQPRSLPLPPPQPLHQQQQQQQFLLCSCCCFVRAAALLVLLLCSREQRSQLQQPAQWVTPRQLLQYQLRATWALGVEAVKRDVRLSLGRWAALLDQLQARL